MDLNTLWFMILGFILTGFLVLDGYDLGIGVLHLFTRDEKKRQAYLRMVGPYWDGNEVWLVVFGAGLFAAFPPVYAAVFSGFYLQLFLFLFALILRDVSIELRSKHESYRWRRFWDICFGVGSFLGAFLLGTLGGNFIKGLPLDQNQEIVGSFWSSLNPFAVTAGLVTVLLTVTHGANYAAMKAEPDHARQLRKIALWVWMINGIVFIAAEILLVVRIGAEWTNKHPVIAGAIIIALVVSYFYIAISLFQRAYIKAFASSSVFCAALLALIGAQLYPRLAPSWISDAYSLTIYNSAASEKSMLIMLVIACLTIPTVIAYTIWVYWLLEKKASGKVEY